MANEQGDYYYYVAAKIFRSLVDCYENGISQIGYYFALRHTFKKMLKVQL